MALNFNSYQHEAELLLQQVAAELGTGSRDQAGRILRTVLHALRDRLTPQDAAHFAAQLPIIWKGIFYDQYRPIEVPVKIRQPQDWIDFIRAKDGLAGNFDFPYDQDVLLAFHAVVRALQFFMSPGTVEKALEHLPHQLRELAEEPV